MRIPPFAPLSPIERKRYNQLWNVYLTVCTNKEAHPGLPREAWRRICESAAAGYEPTQPYVQPNVVWIK